jgi:hypothetical protein
MLSWSPDSRYLYFYNASNRLLKRISMADRRVEEVADLSRVAKRNLTPSFASQGWWFGFTPSEELITLRGRETAEIYAMDLELP